MTPDLPQGSAFDSEATRAETVPSAARLWEMERNASAGSQMSEPPPCTVQVPPL